MLITYLRDDVLGDTVVAAAALHLLLDRLGPRHRKILTHNDSNHYDELAINTNVIETDVAPEVGRRW